MSELLDIEEGKAPLVSIGVPVFNGEKYLTDALRSLCHQTHKNIELVIADNGSTDSSEDICRMFAEYDPRIRYIRREKNFGAADNFRFVLSQARGEYFMWAAGDDYWDSNWVSHLLESMCGSDVCVYGYSKLVYENEKIIEYSLPTFRRNQRLRYFLSMEKKALYTYGLFRTDQLRPVFEKVWRDIAAVAASDHLLMSLMLGYGDLRAVGGTGHYYRYHDSQASKALLSAEDDSRIIKNRRFFPYYLETIRQLPKWNLFWLIFAIPLHYVKRYPVGVRSLLRKFFNSYQRE